MKAKNPWKKLSSKSVYRNVHLALREDAVIRPDGKPGKYSVITILPGIAVLPVDDAGYAYLVSEWHYPTATMRTKPVSGGIDDKETPLSAAKRELMEELGIKAKTWKKLGISNAFTSSVDSPSHLFLARGLSFGKARDQKSEGVGLVKIKLTKAVRDVFSDDISGNAALLILKAAHELSLI